MSTTILALDIGERKIGIARANNIAKIAEPLTTLINDEAFPEKLEDIISKENAGLIVVGLPRGLEGQDTQQTKYVKDFMDGIDLAIPFRFQDEALTSVKAEERLSKNSKSYTKHDIDSNAASIILEDYLLEN